MAPELVADYQCHTGEGPLWHPTEKLLYWADIPTGRMFRYNPATGEHEQFYQGDVVGGFTFQEVGTLLLFMAKGAVATWRDDKLNYIINEIPDERGGRFNDVFADPRGRVFCGSMPTEGRLGRLYRLDTDGPLTTLLEGINVSNGVGFTPDGKQLYYTESMTHRIYLFDYDIDSGNISNQRVWVETSEDEGIPDGMTVDSEGFVWSARFGGSSVIRYTSEGVEERRIRFLATRVTSLIFVGDDLTDIYVTTGGGQNKAEYGSGAGGLFHFNTGIKGFPEFFSRVGL